MQDIDVRAFARANGWNLTSIVRQLEGLSRPERLGSAAVRDLWPARPDPATHHLLYVAVPFCTEKCSFCQLYKYKLEARADTDSYLDHLVQAMSWWAPSFQDVTFRRLTIGGGTPSVLSADQLERLLAAVRGAFRIDDGYSHCFEFTPRTVTDARLEVLRRYGMTKISMGVQTTDAALLDQHARYHQGVASVRRAMELIRAHGFTEVNIDLILGMHGDTPEIFRRSFHEVATLGPDQITVYTLSPQPDYLRQLYGGDVRRWRADYDVHLDAALSWLPAALDEHGYSFRELGAARGTDAWKMYRLSSQAPPPTDVDAIYDHTSPAPVSLLGLGPDAESRISGTARYKDTGPRPAAFDPQEPRYTCHRIDPRGELIKHVAMAIHHDSRVRASNLQRWFGSQLSDELPEVWDELTARGLASWEGEDLVFPGDPAAQLEAGFVLVGADRMRRIGRQVAAHKRVLVLTYGDRRLQLQIEAAAADRSYIAEANGWGLVEVGRRDAPEGADARTRVMVKVLRKALEGAAARGGGDPLTVLQQVATRAEGLARSIGASVVAAVEAVV